MSEILVLGVGNTLLSDEGAGVHALHYLQSKLPDRQDINFVDAGTLSFTLADDIASAVHLIILDAAQLNEKPGTVRVFEDDALDDFIRFGQRSVHEVGFADLMDIARLQNCLPINRALIGIQPQNLGWGERPCEAVEAAFAEVSELAVALITKWSLPGSTQAQPASAVNCT